MSNKKWEVMTTQVTGGYVVRPVGWDRGVATVTQRDPHPIHGQGITWDEALANARLIAAAPDQQARIDELEQWIKAATNDDMPVPDWLKSSARSLLGGGK